MKRASIPFFCLLLLALGGCAKETPPASTGEPVVALPTPAEAEVPDVARTLPVAPAAIDVVSAPPEETSPEELRDWFGQAGDQSLLTLAVWPAASWEATAMLLMDSVPRRKETLPIFGRIRLAKDFGAAAGEFLHLMGYPEWPLSWPALDPARPVLFSLFAPMTALQEPSSWLVAAHETAVGSAGVRHEVLVPALAVGPLREALVAAFSQRLERIDQAVVRAVAPPGSALFQWPTGILAVVMAADHVRVCVLENALYPGQSDAALKARLRDWLTPAPAALPLTPALEFVLASRAPVRAYVRPARLRGVAIQEGLAQLVMAQAYADPGARVDQRVMAAGILGMTWGLLSPASLLYHDLGLTLETEAEFDLNVVASLTAAGARTHGAGGSAVVPATPTGANPGYLVAGIDLAALVQALPPSPLLHPGLTATQRGQRQADIVDSFGKCGPWCSIYLLLGGWPALAAVDRSHARERLPMGLAAVVRSAVFDGGRLQLEAAMAFALPSGGDVQWVKQVGQWLAGVTGWRVTVTSQPIADGLVVAVGINRLAEDLLNLQPSQRHGGAFRLSWRTAVLSDLVRVLAPGLGNWLGKLGPAMLEITARPTTAVIRLSQAPGDRDLLVQPLPHDLSASWQPTPERPLDACMDQAAFALGVALERAPHIALDQLDTYVAQTLDALGRATDCAGADGGQELPRMERVVRLMAAELALATFRLDAAIRYLEAACVSDAGPLCQQLPELRQRPALNLAQVSAPCLRSGLGRTLDVPWLLSDGIWVGPRRRVPTVDGRLETTSLASLVREWPGAVAELAVDARVPKDLLEQVLTALEESPVASLQVLVRDQNGKPALLPLTVVRADGVSSGSPPPPVPLPWLTTQSWAEAAAIGGGLGCRESGVNSPLTLASPASPQALAAVPATAPAPAVNLDNLRGAVQRLFPRFRRCHREQLETLPDFAVEQMLELTLDAAGTVTAATFVKETEVPQDFRRCITEQALKTRFPKGDAPRTFRIPVVFQTP